MFSISYSEEPNKMQLYIKILLFLILNEAEQVSGDTPHIIKSPKLHKQPQALHTCKVVGRAVSYVIQVLWLLASKQPQNLYDIT
jgi:hypothetical protein